MSWVITRGRRSGSILMGDVYKPVRVAAVQAASVFLDREGSTEKACRLIREAGAHGARVIGFPESFIPAHPVWFHHHAATAGISNKLSVELFKNSVEVPGAETEALYAAARDVNAYVVIGVCEKRRSSAQSGRHRLASLRTNEQGLRNFRLRYGRR